MRTPSAGGAAGGSTGGHPCPDRSDCWPSPWPHPCSSRLLVRRRTRATGAAAERGKGDLSFSVVTHGSAGDAFWDVVQNGAKAAGEDLGVSVDYQSDGDPQRQAQLIDAAVNQKVDGIVVSMANPDALQDSVEAAVAAGIPVVTINSGGERSAEFGAIGHVGQDETIAGQGAGQRLAQDGAKKVLCVIHEAGNIGLDQRCSGASKARLGRRRSPPRRSTSTTCRARSRRSPRSCRATPTSTPS